MTQEREYAPKPEPRPIESAIKSRSRSERAGYKARQLRQANGSRREFSYNGIDITITAGPDVQNGVLVVEIQASRDGTPLPVDNPYLFVNPPTKVPDGTWRRETDDLGEERDVPNMREDPGEAFRQIVGQSVERAS